MDRFENTSMFLTFAVSLSLFSKTALLEQLHFTYDKLRIRELN